MKLHGLHCSVAILFSLTLLCFLPLLISSPAHAQVGAAQMLWHSSAFTGVMACSSQSAPLIAAAQGYAEIALYHLDGSRALTIVTGHTD